MLETTGSVPVLVVYPAPAPPTPTRISHKRSVWTCILLVAMLWCWHQCCGINRKWARWNHQYTCITTILFRYEIFKPLHWCSFSQPLWMTYFGWNIRWCWLYYASPSWCQWFSWFEVGEVACFLFVIQNVVLQAGCFGRCVLSEVRYIWNLSCHFLHLKKGSVDISNTASCWYSCFCVFLIIGFYNYT